MIDIAAVRAWLTDTLTSGLPDAVTVLPRGVDGPFTPPAVLLGQPDVDFDAGQLVARTDRVLWPVAVVVRQAPDGPAATQAELEDLWPVVAGVLRNALDADPDMGGLCSAAWVASSSFGSLQVQGAAFPAQEITVEINGG